MRAVQLRRGTAADVAAMYQLDCLCFEKPFRFDLRTMRRFALKPGSIVVVAEDGDLLVGFVILDVTRRKILPSAYLVTLDVHPEYRRRGIAQELMREVMGRALEQAVTHVNLHVHVGNFAALRFYEAFGFVQFGQVEDFYGPGLDAVWCMKRIAG